MTTSTTTPLQPDPSHPWRRLETAAYLAIAAHLTSGLVLLILLRPGLDTNPDPAARLDYILTHRAAWIVGWLSCHAAAFSIVWFIIAAVAAFCPSSASLSAAAHTPASPTAAVGRLAIILVTAAMTLDLAGQSIAMIAIPTAALTDIPALHRSAIVLMGYAANGLYSLATLALVAVAWRKAPRFASFIGLIVVAAGLALSHSVLENRPAGMVWCNVILLPAIILWLASLAFTARQYQRGEGSSSRP